MQALRCTRLALQSNLFSSVNLIQSNNLIKSLVNSFVLQQPKSLIASVNHQQIRGLKHRDMLTLRCPDCYFKKVEDEWFVLCPTYPRHKQVERVWDIREKWIVTHKTRRGKPFMKKEESYIIGTCPPSPFDYKPKIGQRIRTRRQYLHPTMVPSEKGGSRDVRPNIIIGLTRFPTGITNTNKK